MGNLKDILGFMGKHPILTVSLAAMTVMAVSDISQNISQIKQEIKHEQVIGGSLGDTYIELGGEKYFSKIDGLSIEDNYHTENDF